MPALTGDQFSSQFSRQGSEPDVVEREILLPLVARVGELPGLTETWGEVNGWGGRLRLGFERGMNQGARDSSCAISRPSLTHAAPRHVDQGVVAGPDRGEPFRHDHPGDGRRGPGRVTRIVEARVQPLAAVTRASARSCQRAVRRAR